MSKISFDIDIDCADRNAILKHIQCIPASIIKDGELTRHNTGVYVQKIPFDPMTGLATYDYKEAEQLGYLKLDFLNMNVYEMVKDEAHLDRLMDKEPNWNRLLDARFSSKLVHIGNYPKLLGIMQPSSIEEMAMFLAIIRPGKKHLIGKSWKEIEKEVWIKTGDGYEFKKSHGISYGHLVGVHMNLLEEQGF
jgi:hypothetical protein